MPKAEIPGAVKLGNLKAGLDEYGREIPDPTPLAPPIGYTKQKTMVDHIREMVRSEKLRQEMEASGHESFEDADDFEVGDDYEPTSPYEAQFEPSSASELRRRERAASAPSPATVPVNPSPGSPPTPPPPAEPAPVPPKT